MTEIEILVGIRSALYSIDGALWIIAVTLILKRMS